MEALTSLGINGKMFIAQVINFLILLFILNKLLYKPVLKMFDDRRSKIEDGLKAAEDAKKTLAGAELESEKIKERAFKESTELINNAKTEALIEAKSILADAHLHAEKIIKNASNEALSVKNKAMSEAKSQISELITTSLTKIIKNNVDQITKDKLTREAVREFAE